MMQFFGLVSADGLLSCCATAAPVNSILVCLGLSREHRPPSTDRMSFGEGQPATNAAYVGP
jgi:hypothetical protein